ncbi:sensor histidine kinase [Actinomadura harenae]|uniref:histidine kinase n=1 Tax=Actinomadura harenae TaxID=2483351 RepID=A0A3M2M005_9ACTN|nr:histidine kinase [Actinomadura harenae]RMI42897.1 histidine kinase [Actinomadura harenae]
MRGGRSARKWAGDVGVTALGALLALVTVGLSQIDQPSRNSGPAQIRELVLGAVCCLAVLLFRRTRPVPLAVVLILAQFLGAAAYGVAAVAVFNVAAMRPWRVAVPIGVAETAVVCGLMTLASTSRQGVLEGAVVFTLLHAVLVTAGMLVRSRRLLVESLRERARQAEEGQRLRVEEARLLERERLAREMHDVLAHRISLLAVHAGALEFGPDAPRAQRDAAGIIRRGAYEAMEDLREVIGVLRTGPEVVEGAPERPQPTLADIPSLVTEARSTGDRVDLDDQVGEDGGVPGRIGRHAYRIVQEGLTNARKHAPGARVRVGLLADGGRLIVMIENPLPPGSGAADAGRAVAGLPGAGAGLLGLGERVALVGGTLTHGRTPDGTFLLVARLPLGDS